MFKKSIGVFIFLIVIANKIKQFNFFDNYFYKFSKYLKTLGKSEYRLKYISL